jgi:hypothetical protein
VGVANFWGSVVENVLHRYQLRYISYYSFELLKYILSEFLWVEGINNFYSHPASLRHKEDGSHWPWLHVCVRAHVWVFITVKIANTLPELRIIVTKRRHTKGLNIIPLINMFGSDGRYICRSLFSLCSVRQGSRPRMSCCRVLKQKWLNISTSEDRMSDIKIILK